MCYVCCYVCACVCMCVSFCMPVRLFACALVNIRVPLCSCDCVCVCQYVFESFGCECMFAIV